MRLKEECKLPKIKVTNEQLLELFRRDIIPIYCNYTKLIDISANIPFNNDIVELFNTTYTHIYFQLLDYYILLGKEIFIKEIKAIRDELIQYDIEDYDSLHISIQTAIDNLQDENFDDIYLDSFIEWAERQIKRNIFEPHFEIIN